MMNGLARGEASTTADILRVLIVDDEPDVREFLVEAVRLQGCDPIPASYAPEALAVLDRTRVDLVVSDIRLPGPSGLDLLEQIAKRRPGTAVVLITGFPSVESAACGARYHAYDYLAKPVSVEDLRKLVERFRQDRQRARPAEVADDPADQTVQTEVLVRLGQVAFDGGEPGGVLDRVLADVSRSLRTDAALIVRRDRDGTFTHRRRGHGAALDALPGLLTAALPTLVGMETAVAVPIAPPDGPVAAMATVVPTASGTVLLAIGREAGHGAFLPKEPAFLLAYGRIAALALERLAISEEVEGQIQDTIGSLVRTLEARDPALRGHAARVSLYGGEIATALRVSDPQLHVTRRAGLLHDLGKLTVLDAVLQKAGPLTPDEYRLVQRHPLAGERMLRPLAELAADATVVRHHAERYDGTGYPDRIKGTDIPLPSRIIAVADAFDAMTSRRPYRAARPLDEARAEVLRQAGRQFDPTVVDAFSAIPAGRLAEVSCFYRQGHEDRVA